MRRHLAVAGAAAAILAVGAGAGAVAASAAGTSGVDMHQQMSVSTTMPMTGMAGMHNGSMPMDQATMDAMHDSLRDAMPPALRAACDKAHAAMTATSSEGSTHAAHHPNG